MTLRELTVAVVGGLLLGSAFLLIGSDPRLQTGSRSPTLAVPVVANGTGSARLAVPGHVTVVDFFASWCSVCAATVPRLEQQAKRAGVRVVAVSVDSSAGSALAAAAGWHIDGPVAWDDGGRARRAFGIRALPTVIVTAPDGTITATHVGAVSASALRADIRRAKAGGR